MKSQRKRLLITGHVAPHPQWHLDAHFHHFHELIVVFSGRMRITIGGQTLAARAGDVLFYPKGVPHEEAADPTDPAETYFVGFEPDDGMDLALPFLSRDTTGRIRQLISWLYADRDLCASVEQEAPRTLLRSMLAELQRAGNLREDQLVAQVRQYIYDHIDQALTLEELAREAGMSKFHFLRRYKQLTGRTPMQDVRSIRTEYARELILTTNLPLKVIAPKAGLGNEFHLSRMFRKHLQTPPGQIRKKVKNNSERPAA